MANPPTQAERAAAFLQLHDGDEPLLIPNPWDRGSAKLLASLGCKALATTSGGFAASLGRLDGHVTRDEALGHAKLIASATDLPVSALSGIRRTIRGVAAGNGKLCYHRRARGCGRFHAMPNIKQQKKRVRTAAAERLENLRYSSTIKTLTKRLAVAVEGGDAAAIEAEHRGLVKMIDRAVTRGALHRNTGARKKSQAARLVSRRPA